MSEDKGRQQGDQGNRMEQGRRGWEEQMDQQDGTEVARLATAISRPGRVSAAEG